MLLLVITLLGTRLHDVITTPPEIPTEPTAATSRKYETKPDNIPAHTDSAYYDVILSKNLFHPSRSITKKTPEETAPVSKNEIPQLFGTIILNDKKSAILQDQATKKSNLYEINDTVSGFIVSQILKNKVILEKRGESIEVSLRADKKFTPPKRSPVRQRAIRRAPAQRRRPNVRRSRPQRSRTPVQRTYGR